MSASHTVHPILKGEQRFQDFCQDLYKSIWADPEAKPYARRGVMQSGIDLVGDDARRDGARSAVQCKGAEIHTPREPTVDELKADVASAREMVPPIHHFTFAYAGFRSRELQDAAAELTIEHRKTGLFAVHVTSWEDLVAELEDHPHVRNKYFPIEPDAMEASLRAMAVRIGRDRANRAEDIAAVRRIGTTVASLTFVEAAEQDDGEDSALHQQFDRIRTVLAEGRTAVALEMLNGIQERLPKDVGKRAMFRMHAQRGHAMLALGRNDDAIRELTSAAGIAPKTADRHAYAAYAAIQADKRDVAFMEASAAIADDPSHKLAMSLWVECAPPEMAPDEIAARVADGHGNDVDVARALSRRYTLAGDIAKAVEWADAATKDDLLGWIGDAAAGDALLHQASDSELAKLGGEIDADMQRHIADAVQRLERAWVAAKARPDAERWAYIANNLASAYTLAGRREDAYRAIDEAFGVASDDFLVRRRKAATDVPRGKAKEAWALISASAKDGTLEDRHFAAEVALAADADAEALALVTTLLPQLPEGEKAHASWVAVTAALSDKDKTLALKTFDALKADVGADPAFLQAGIGAARQAGDLAKAEALDAELLTVDSATLGPVQKFEFARALGERGRWSEAADTLKGLYRADRASPALQEVFIAFLNADRRRDAEALYESLAPQVRANPRYRRFGAATYERLGNLQQAVTEMDALLDVQPDDMRSRLDWIRLLLRSGDLKRASNWIKKCKAPPDAEPHEFMELAYRWDSVGRSTEAISLAYRTLRDNWGRSEELHGAYMGLFLERRHASRRPKKPKTVQVDTWVRLTDGAGATHEFIIEGQLTPDAARNEIAPSHAMATMLLGCKVGDEIAFGPQHAPETRVVREILHKSVRLFQRAIAENSALFPSSGAIGRIAVDFNTPKPLAEMERMSRERAEHVEGVERGYLRGEMPLCTAAKLLNLDPYSAWAGLAARGHINIRMARGDPDSRARAVEAVNASQAAVIDPLTFMQWRDYGLLPLVQRRFGKLLVAQSLLDVVAQTLDEARARKNQKAGSLEWTPQGMRYYEFSKAQNEATIEYWEKAQADVATYCDVQPVESLAALGIDEDLTQIMPQPFVDAIALALESKTLLLCDDLMLREIASYCGVERTAWCQPFVFGSIDAGQATWNDSAALAAKLARHRAIFVTVHAHDLTAALADAEVTQGLYKALGQATPPSTVKVIADHIWQAWNMPSVIELARNALMVRIIMHFRLHKAANYDMILRALAQALEEKADQWSAGSQALSLDARKALRFASMHTRV